MPRKSVSDLFSGKDATHQRSREAEINLLQTRVGELTIQTDFILGRDGK